MTGSGCTNRRPRPTARPISHPVVIGYGGKADRDRRNRLRNGEGMNIMEGRRPSLASAHSRICSRNN
ncbi:hypothetical protein BDV18DRAFT_149425 [Aspergillus unguis]